MRLTFSLGVDEVGPPLPLFRKLVGLFLSAVTVCDRVCISGSIIPASVVVIIINRFYDRVSIDVMCRNEHQDGTKTPTNNNERK